MAIKDEYVETSWNRSTCTYYKSLGYKFTKNGDSLMIKAYELKPKSDVKITAICEECGEERKIARYNYRDICSKCNGKRCSKLAHKKIKELCENPEYRENKRKRLSEHCRRYMLTNEVKKRVKVINRETFKRLWKDPEFAKRVKAGCKEYFKNKVNEGVF